MVIIKAWVHRVGHSPDRQIFRQIACNESIIASTPACTNNVIATNRFSLVQRHYYLLDFFSPSMGKMYVSVARGASSFSVSPLARYEYRFAMYSVHRFMIFLDSVRHIPF